MDSTVLDLAEARRKKAEAAEPQFPFFDYEHRPDSVGIHPDWKDKPILIVAQWDEPTGIRMSREDAEALGWALIAAAMGEEEIDAG